MEENRAQRAWRRAEHIKKLSDRVIGIGPFGLGVDGVLAWVPGLNAAYSLGAAAVLMHSAFTGGASRSTLLKMAAFLAADAAASGVPVAGWAVDTFFPGHLLAARTLQKDLEGRWGQVLKPRP